jgi:hypothetical protein
MQVIASRVNNLFDGYVGSVEEGYIATPEKGLFDTVYLLSSRGSRILLPEVELPEGFERTRLEDWATRVTPPRLRTLVRKGLTKVLQAGSNM